MNFLLTPFGLFFLFLVILSIIILFHRRTSKSSIGCIGIISIVAGILLLGLTIGILWYISADELYQTIVGTPPSRWDFLVLLKVAGLSLAVFFLSLIGITAVSGIFVGRLPNFVKKTWSRVAEVFLLPLIGLIVFSFATTLLYQALMGFFSPGYEHIGIGAGFVIFLFGAAIMAAFLGIACFTLDLGTLRLKKYKEPSNGRTFRLIKAGKLPVEPKKAIQK